jgi:3-phenylpropionate/cinnamic acid dioxygenase small subunit
MSMDDRFKIQEMIARFANSFDIKDWNGLESCFTDSLNTDYSDLRGTAPEKVKASEYVSARRESLDPLKLHHLVSNYEIDLINSNTATCRASMIVWRKSDEEEFTSHCVYTFQLTKQESDWKISGITQKVLWNEGTQSIHRGGKI